MVGGRALWPETPRSQGFSEEEHIRSGNGQLLDLRAGDCSGGPRGMACCQLCAFYLKYVRCGTRGLVEASLSGQGFCHDVQPTVLSGTS